MKAILTSYTLAVNYHIGSLTNTEIKSCSQMFLKTFEKKMACEATRAARRHQNLPFTPTQISGHLHCVQSALGKERRNLAHLEVRGLSPHDCARYLL